MATEWNQASTFMVQGVEIWHEDCNLPRRLLCLSGASPTPTMKATGEEDYGGI
ncbi:hypothetical protein SETIT_4G098600v2 [Setaria italica]|uniref:Uncharacterized protein n=2 Tax=Setaria TaxID=4554 RepID=A0A368QSQ8_SETIT|nr:hypothetical protein SETIT_4G098600v2 [Setaria italica]TKW20572.1 hypothetical protein SEVIR_4G097600v2 [Setaria viridis]